VSQISEKHPLETSELTLVTKSVGVLAVLTGLIYLRAVGLEGGDPLFMLLLLIGLIGLVVAWWREGLGGVVAVASAVGLAIVAYRASSHHPLFSAFAYSSPFLISGLLFLCCWQRGRKE
jgi:hypothetical protein